MLRRKKNKAVVYGGLQCRRINLRRSHSRRDFNVVGLERYLERLYSRIIGREYVLCTDHVNIIAMQRGW